MGPSSPARRDRWVAAAAAAARAVDSLAARRARLIWLGLAASTFVGLLLLARHLTFWQDEWSFIGAEPTSIGSYLTPHNEHWSTVPLLLYKSVLAVVGLHSYLPYLVVLVGLHVIAAGGAFVLLGHRVPPWAALVAVLPLLVLGSGYENLLWAFQIGFVTSVAAGAWGLAVLEGDRRRKTAVAGTGLLVVSLASSGIGLFFLVAAAVRLLADPLFRQRAVWLVVPTAVYAVWYLAYGRQGLSGHLAAPGAALVFAARGLSHAVARIAGFDLAGHASVLGWILAVAALGFAIIVLVRHAAGRVVPALAVGGLVATAAMYFVIGLTRAGLATDFATRSRYVYVAAFLLIPAVGDLLAWLAAGRRIPRPAIVGLVALACLSIGANVLDLRHGRAEFTEHAGLTRAYLTVIADQRGAARLDPKGLPLGWPAFERLDALLARYGSPLRDTIVASDATPARLDQLDQATLGLARAGFHVAVGPPPRAARPVMPTILDARSARFASSGSCVAVTVSGTGGSVTAVVPGGGWLELAGPAGNVTATLGHALPPTPGFPIVLPTSTGDAATLAVPDLGDGSSWQVRVDLPSGSSAAELCVSTP